MFWTHRRAEIPIHGHFDHEAQAWTHVKQSLHEPWFYVTVAEGLQDETLLTMSQESAWCTFTSSQCVAASPE